MASTPIYLERSYTFEVYGLPQPAGSKRAFPFKRKDGRTGVAVTDANPKAKSWKQEVRAAAYGRVPLLQRGRPVGLGVVFHLPRPQGHYRTGKQAGSVRPSAPALPTVKPDLTKLLRAIEDALTGVAWADDSQVVQQNVSKAYARDGRARTTIWIVLLEGRTDAEAGEGRADGQGADGGLRGEAGVAGDDAQARVVAERRPLPRRG